jgi:hypothetical protein
MKRERSDFWHVAAGLVSAVAFLSLSAQAQSGKEGLNAVYGPSNVIQGSTAFIDATPYLGTGDICAALNNIILSVAGVGAVIDARGVHPGTPQACAQSPWQTLPPTGTFANVTILLPKSTITTETPWVVPNFTHIVGQGPGQTIIQACKTTSTTCPTGAFSGSAMIVLGSDTAAFGCGTGVCFGIQVSDLTLDAQSQALDGVDNANAEEQSYVRHVSMVNIGGTGLRLSADTDCSSLGTSSNSGPYNDLNIGISSTAAACVKVLNLAGSCPQTAHPRGLHGISCQCIAAGTACTNPNSGIQLDGGAVSVENIFLNGFHDGIAIGDQANTLGPIQSELIVNVRGGSNVTNLVHIYNATAGQLSDITILGATSSTPTSNVTILDDLNGPSLANSNNANVGMYVLGESVGGGNGFTRFTTSTTLPTWFVGSTTVTGPCSSLANGTLYSNTSGTAGSTLYACGNGTWQNLK